MSPQIINGLILGAPGVAGSAPIYLLLGSGVPANSTDPNVAQAALGSLYVDYAGPGLYQKTTLPNSWTQIS